MEKELPNLSSAALKKKLEAGEEIKGYQIDRITLGKREIEFPINLIECKIDTLDFNKSVFQQDVFIRRCDINVLVLSDAVFTKKFDMKKSKTGRGRIQNATFQSDANFDGAGFAYTSFHKSTFGGKTDFSRSSFYGDATFTGTTFKDDANFIYAQIQGKGVFSQSRWEKLADFKNVQIEDDLDFFGATFKGKLLLNSAVVKLSINLAYAHLENRTDFGDVMARRNIVLTGTNLGEKQGFRFSNVATSAIILERETVEGHVFPEAEGKYRQASKEYGFLRTNFQSLNRFEDEDWAYYNFKRMERKARKTSYNPIKWLLNLLEYLFLDLGCGYGTKPFRTIGASGILILGFAAVYFFYFRNVAIIENYGVSSITLNKLLHSLNISVVAFSGGYGDLVIKGSIKLVAMLEYLAGVVFMGVFVVSFSRKVIR